MRWASISGSERQWTSALRLTFQIGDDDNQVNIIIMCRVYEGMIMSRVLWTLVSGDVGSGWMDGRREGSFQKMRSGFPSIFFAMAVGPHLRG